ncbi:vacuolar carboxypeptidase Cps1 [Aspergillus japonicus CBS 114.51]|uniref:Vacuolar carboxypeptidase Cps1 n=2 Tax=Aspergillus TaxID=5052 RepID=A0A2V5GZN3_ASPV1|nr:vacuolar carboxypeptidase Cps1 [Aspergillus japonicus CBS 114.51]PYI14882.1 vacuolar carboxypeptidase Cps1 [Aspergillus violaceofuscus CBS 115571]RAH84746.1 vacuolar carboxypeptidase Cps1 [Aspergillus japonicus CBS 114.51]
MYQLLPVIVGLLAPSVASLSVPSAQQLLNSWSSGASSDLCPLATKIEAPDDGFFSSVKFVTDDAVKSRQVDRLSRAVQVPTAIDDYMKDPYDEKFAPFLEFHELLQSLFPLLHSHARVDHVNRLGLVYTLNGTDDSLKPILFLAHQDVVPINDAADWTYPPFAGHFDGEWLWGRGASDCKNVLIGLLSAVEDLLAQDWQPTRSVLFAFGFDEESHGFLGAGNISEFLQKKYGPDSFEFILDEGGMGLETFSDNNDPNKLASATDDDDDGVIYALPGVGEKGSIDIVLSLAVPGGHSSVPPPHTGIGIVSEIIYSLERQDLFIPVLDGRHPSRQKLECQVRHSPAQVEPWLASALRSADHVSLAERLAESRGDKFRFILQTSQAADLVAGGVKSNALPEKISALVNYRVALHQTPQEIQRRAVDIIGPIARKYNLSVTAFPADNQVDTSLNNHLTLTTLSGALDPAPVSPTDLRTDPVWARFSGVTRAVFESVPALHGKTVVVSGDIMTGNTDTRFYWPLTRNIYRWSPSRAGRAVNIHTVDERVGIDAHLEAIMLYYDLIRSFDAWEGSPDEVSVEL